MNKLFVYGTLMEGQPAHSKLEGCKYLGTYRLKDYAMYKVASYPGIVKQEGENVVGEVYEISEDMILSLDYYEGEGSLYKRTVVTVSREKENIEVYAYVYLNQIDKDAKPMREKWNAKDTDYVWYACYGSNLDEERFENYIVGGTYPLTGKYTDGCKDKSRWIDSKMATYKGHMYFGNVSGTWEGKGVAFYDQKGGYTYMRLYKITREQFQEVRRQEGSSSNWYGRIVCLDVLEDNCPVYTITSEMRHEDNDPSDKYFNLIKKALMKNLNQSEFEVDNYLAGCSESIDRKVREKYQGNATEYDEKMHRERETSVASKKETAVKSEEKRI